MNYEEFILDKDPRDYLMMTGLNFVDKNTYAQVFCPYHINTKTPAGVLYFDTGIYKCFSCGEIKSFFEFLKDQGVSVDIKSEKEVADIHFLRKVRERRSIKVQKKNIYKPKTIDDSHHMDRYLARRGATDKFKVALDISYDENSKRIIIPFYDNESNIRSYEKRAVGPNNIKVLYNSGVRVNDFIFLRRSIDYNKKLHLVEGMMDLIPLIETDVENYSHTFGSNITKEQLAILNLFPEIELYLDGDEAGIKWFKTIEENYTGTIVAIHYIEGKDPNDCWLDGSWISYLEFYYTVDDFLYQIIKNN